MISTLWSPPPRNARQWEVRLTNDISLEIVTQDNHNHVAAAYLVGGYPKRIRLTVAPPITTYENPTIAQDDNSIFVIAEDNKAYSIRIPLDETLGPLSPAAGERFKILIDTYWQNTRINDLNVQVYELRAHDRQQFLELLQKGMSELGDEIYLRNSFDKDQELASHMPPSTRIQQALETIYSAINRRRLGKWITELDELRLGWGILARNSEQQANSITKDIEHLMKGGEWPLAQALEGINEFYSTVAREAGITNSKLRTHQETVMKAHHAPPELYEGKNTERLRLLNDVTTRMNQGHEIAMKNCLRAAMREQGEERTFMKA